jgi:hypothetical protein
MKTYKLICSTFGWKFSFNADNDLDATSKKNGWCRYHSFDSNDFSIEETNDNKRIHNEYM